MSSNCNEFPDFDDIFKPPDDHAYGHIHEGSWLDHAPVPDKAQVTTAPPMTHQLTENEYVRDNTAETHAERLMREHIENHHRLHSMLNST